MNEVITEMLDLNAVIANNVLSLLKETGTKQNDLAKALDVSKQTMSKILSGVRTINATELFAIANFFKVDVRTLSRAPAVSVNSNTVRAFMGTVESAEAKEALNIADELADLIVFHAKVRKNAEEMMQPWED